MKTISFSEKEFLCQQAFDSHGPYWHIATPGAATEILFTNTADYCFGMNLVAESQYLCSVKSYSFSLMSNHLHNIVEAVRIQNCLDFLEHYSKRFLRYAKRTGRILNLDGFVCDPIPIDNLQSLRNNMVYVDRNAYVVNSALTPYSHPWGSGFLYFGYNPTLLATVPFSSLPLEEKRRMMHTRTCHFPDNYGVRNGIIAPETFVEWKIGRSFFRDAHQFFNLLTKNRESYAEFGAVYGDRIVLTDEEMYSATVALAQKSFQKANLKELLPEQKMELARKIHFDYKANNAQIFRILKLDKPLLNELFPTAQ